MKHAIFGDVAGHYGPFKRGLESVGVSVKDLTIPDGLVIVQIGDLVHKGPNSALVVDLVDQLMQANPGQWVQLAGNHELPYVMDHRFFSPDRVDLQTAATLYRWREEGLLRASYAVSASDGQDYLITHAGLTSDLYRRYIAYGATDAVSTSAFLEGQDWAELATTGTMFNGSYPNPLAGVFWAEGVSEVYASWLRADGAPPFHQVHGHSSSYLWERSRPRFNYPEWFTQDWSKDFERMHTTFSVRGMNFHAIDPGLERKAFTKVIQPLVLS